jgi:peptidoglycan/LPS O-acetylase OafA/YrhL
MKNAQKRTIILWMKRFIGILAIALWGFAIFSISQSPAPFAEQAPYCMGSTMLIFGLLSMAFKGLEYWGKDL